MNILYLANIRLPTEKAHGAQIMKMCEAFAAAGAKVELVVTNRRTISEDPFAYYGVEKTFTITRLPVWNTVGWGSVGFWFESLTFARAANKYLRSHGADLIYGRDELVLRQLDTTVPVIWETHTGAWNKAAQELAVRASKIVAISQGLKDFYVAHGVPAEKIIVAHDGIDLAPFAKVQSQEDTRRRLGLPLDARIAMYVGRLDGWKGTDTLLKAAKDFAPMQLVIIGGEPKQVQKLLRQYPSVRFLGYRPYRELADNLAAADVLVLPNTGQDKVSAHFTSPLKLFAYMAAGKPIIASDLPSIREVLDTDEAYFFTPDDPQSLARAVRVAVGDSGAERRAAAAWAKVKRYTWQERAMIIMRAL
ncbi:MAG TPA: glycosyltransferase family 4 protein [Candidatus Paceibacterota bacterium]